MGLEGMNGMKTMMCDDEIVDLQVGRFCYTLSLSHAA